MNSKWLYLSLILTGSNAHADLAPYSAPFEQKNDNYHETNHETNHETSTPRHLVIPKFKNDSDDLTNSQNKIHNEVLRELYSELKPDNFIKKDYMPPWLKDSGYQPIGGWSLYLQASILWFASITGFEKGSFGLGRVEAELPKNGIGEHDPELFDEEALNSLNQHVKNLVRTPSPLETDNLDDADKEYAWIMNNASNGIDVIHSLFASGELTPSQLVKNINDWYDTQLPFSMKDVLIKRDLELSLQAAKASDIRWQQCRDEFEGQIEACKKNGIIKPLDGIPTVVKDEVNVAGYSTSFGFSPDKMHNHTFPPKTAQEESLVVTRFKDAGMIVLGKSNQHILGLGGTGDSGHYPRLTNAYSKNHVPGGSSSGSAVAVALQIVQLALGTDGGGSVNIPASLNALVGLKPTLDKIPTIGYDNAAPGLVSHGVIANDTYSASRGYTAASGKHPTSAVIEVLKTLKIAVDTEWFQHASEDVASQTLQCLDQLSSRIEQFGHNSNPVVKMQFMPKDSRKQMWATHMLLFGKGEADGNGSYVYDKGTPDETWSILLMGKALSVENIANADKNRNMLKNHFNNNLFGKAHVLAMPTTLTTAPKKYNPALQEDVGELDLAKAYLVSFNTAVANVTGHPRITIPCGYGQDDKLPIGLQLTGNYDSEFLLLFLSRLMELEAGYQLKKRAPALVSKPFDPREPLQTTPVTANPVKPLRDEL